MKKLFAAVLFASIACVSTANARDYYHGGCGNCGGWVAANIIANGSMSFLGAYLGAQNAPRTVVVQQPVYVPQCGMVQYGWSMDGAPLMRQVCR